MTGANKIGIYSSCKEKSGIKQKYAGEGLQNGPPAYLWSETFDVTGGEYDSIQNTKPNTVGIMDNKRVSEFYMGKREMKLIEGRIHLMERMIDEIRRDGKMMEISMGKVWKWFKVRLWKPILVESGLSDEGKLKVMRLCVLEKVKYQNMGDKGMKGFVVQMIVKVKGEEKKVRFGVGRAGMEMGEAAEEAAAVHMGGGIAA